MSLAAERDEAGAASAFSPKVVLALLLVVLFGFSAFFVLQTYAPEIRAGEDGSEHALSRSAIGYAGVVELLRLRGVPVIVSRAARAGSGGLLVVTPPPGAPLDRILPLKGSRTVLVVLPKWIVFPDPTHRGWVRKLAAPKDAAPSQSMSWFGGLKAQQAGGRAIVRIARVQASAPLPSRLDAGSIDRLQTLADSPDWVPLARDAAGRTIIAGSVRTPGVYVLSEPDLLNNQGLKSLGGAQAAMQLIDALRAGGPVVFDVTLNGFERGRSLTRLMFEPPFLAATLCALGAAALMGLHAWVRFGPTPPERRAFALGPEALVDNSAALIRVTRKEAELAARYAALTDLLAARSAGLRGGEDPQARLQRLTRTPDALARHAALHAAAARAKTRDEVLAAARDLYHWRLEMTRDRR